MILVILFTGCTNEQFTIDEQNAYILELELKLEENKSVIDDLEEINEKLNEEKKVLNELISSNDDNHDTANKVFREISNLTLEFARARTDGDMDRLKELLSSDFTLYKENDEIWSKSESTGYTNLLHFSRRKETYHDMCLAYYKYDENIGGYIVYTDEYFVDNDRNIEGVAFVYLTIIKEDDKWKILTCEFDI